MTNAELKHTATPLPWDEVSKPEWHVNDTYSRRCIHISKSCEDKIICRVYGDNDKNLKANAALIVQAVNNYQPMLSLLQMIARDMKRIVDGEVDGDRALAEAVLMNIEDTLGGIKDE